MLCRKQTRRSLLLATLATGAFLSGRFAAAQEDQPGSSDRPKKGDLLVVSEGERAGDLIRPDDLNDLENWLAWTPEDGKPRMVSIKNKKKKDKN
jgi:rieske iron-sulfur protein